MVRGKISPGAKREGPFARRYAEDPAQRHCCGIAEGLCLSAMFSSAWLYGQTLVPAQATSLHCAGTHLPLQLHGADQGEK